MEQTTNLRACNSTITGSLCGVIITSLEKNHALEKRMHQSSELFDNFTKDLFNANNKILSDFKVQLNNYIKNVDSDNGVLTDENLESENKELKDKNEQLENENKILKDKINIIMETLSVNK